MRRSSGGPCSDSSPSRSSKGPTRAGASRGQGLSISTAGRIDDVELRLGEESLQGPPEERFVILRKGKKNYVRLVLDP